MVQSGAKSVEAYLKELPPERREAVAAVRALVLDHLPAGYVEATRWGMICYEIPIERYPETYNGQRSPTSPSPRRRTTTRST
jgi:hypothetical protein